MIRRQQGDVQAARVGGVGTQHEWSAGVADQRYSPTGRRGLAIKEQADVDEFFQRASADDSGVREEGVDERFVAGQRAV